MTNIVDQYGLEWEQPKERVSKRHIVFEEIPVKDEVASTEAGRPVHKSVDMVSISNPGSRDCHTEPVKGFIKKNPQDEEVRRLYERWVDREKRNVIQGTPLKELPFLSRSDVADFHAQNIFSAEQLVGLNDSAKHRFHNINHIIGQVDAFLKLAEDTKHATKLADENAKMTEEINFLKRTIKDLGDQVQALKVKSK